jgi:acetyltransferase-like isoleucine patch superfamily enzyme
MRGFELWRALWTRFSGPSAIGRIAGTLAQIHTPPFRRSHLADFHSKGFVSPSVRIHHPQLKLGAHVWVGDRTVILAGAEAGAISLEDRVHLYGDTVLQSGQGASIIIGAGTHIQPQCHIHAFLSDIQIGCNVEMAACCALYSYNHGMSLGRDVMFEPLESKGPILIGDGVWIGHGTTVLANVRIGAGAVIGAGSVVTREIPENCIAAGNPAKIIRRRT